MATQLPPSSPQLLELAGRIADGAPVDWDAEGESLDPALLARLKDVEALAGRCLFDDERPAHEPPALEAGSRFDRLQILERIGAGASGVVYRARDPVIGREVALKVCAPNAERRAALLQEARRMARVEHPNVLKVYGAVEIDGVVGFWSDLVRGESLDAWMRSRPTLGAREAALIGLELCAALAAIHAQGMVHGDVKPANVLRHPSGHWVLLDFGSSAVLSGPATSGTPLYLAPELIAGGRATTASDIYALGVMLFRLASGRFPREAEDLIGLLEAHRSGRRLRLLDLRPDLDPAFVAAVEKALETAASDRHRSAGDFAHALDASLPRRPTTRGWLAWGAAALGAAALVAALVRPAVAPAEPRLSLQRIAGDVELSLGNGDAVQPGDGIALLYRNSEVAHVYVVNEDSRGESYLLFPLPGAALSNPLPAGKDIRLPGKVDDQDQDWQVTSSGGDERFYVIVSDRPLPDVEQLGLASAGSFEALMQSTSTRLALNGDALRGTAGLRPRAQASEPGDSRVSRWIESVQREDEQVYVRRFDLRNP